MSRGATQGKSRAFTKKDFVGELRLEANLPRNSADASKGPAVVVSAMASPTDTKPLLVWLTARAAATTSESAIPKLQVQALADREQS